MMPQSQRSRSTGKTRRLLRGAMTQRLHTMPGKFAPEKHPRKCKATEKIRWLTQLDAQMAIANRDVCWGSNTIRTGHSFHEVRVYQCPHCEHWHTTHVRVHRERPDVPERAPAKGPHPAHRALPSSDPQELAG